MSDVTSYWRGVQRFALRPPVVRAASLVFVFVAWEIFGRTEPIFMSYPTAVLQALFELLFIDRSMPEFLATTLRGLAVGYAIAVVVGVVIGLLMGRIRPVRTVLEPYVNALYATPRITIIPLLVIWVGIDYELRVTVVALSSVFPIIINTYNGAMAVEGGLLDAGRVFLAGRLAMARTVVLPAALPYIFAGLKVSSLRALSAVIVAETTAAITGTGAALFAYARAFQTDRLFATILVLGFMGIAFGKVLDTLQQRIAPWSHAVRRAER